MTTYQERQVFEIEVEKSQEKWFRSKYKTFFEIKGSESIDLNIQKLLLQTRNYIGTIRLPNGKSIFIKPKIRDAKILYMLLEINYKYLKILEPIAKNVGKSNILNFFELLIEKFLNTTEGLILHQLHRKLKSHIKYSQKIKGKVLISKSFKKSNILLGKFYCEFDEFSLNNLENQIIKYVLYQLFYCVKPEQKLRIQRLLSRLNKVSLKSFTESVFYKLRYNKLNKHYRPIHLYCQMFIERFILGMNLGTKSIHSFVIDTAKLFEEYVRTLLEKNLTNFECYKGFKDQNLSPLLIKGKTKAPDIIISKYNMIYLIGDAKYKKKYNWREDAWQMMSYLRICILLHKKDPKIKFPEQYRHALLIYPKLIKEDFNFDKNYNSDEEFTQFDIGDNILGDIWYLRINLSKIDSNEYISSWIRIIKNKFLKSR